MLKLNDLKPAVGSVRTRMRVGRGQGSGNGTTAGHGNNGHKARSGSREKAYFEGGQTPLIRRTPKRGFTSQCDNEYQIVNVGRLEELGVADKEIDAGLLFENGLISSSEKPVKILGGGTLTKNLIVKVEAYSKTARDKLKMPKAPVAKSAPTVKPAQVAKSAPAAKSTPAAK
jgi:large subunit ribosomal protein L15